jgi:simple sugar transport system permease protein
MARRLPRHELTLLVVIVAIAAAIGTINPAFFSPDNLFDLLKSSVTLGILAVGTLVVLVSGGIDVSFPAIAAACMYVTCTLALHVASLDHLALLMGGSIVLGLALGLVNGLLVHAFRLPALIVTLGTASLIRGAVLEFVGTRNITNLPSSIIWFSRATLFQRPLAPVLFLAAAAALVAFVLRRTLLGRGVYALGADAVAAERVGFNVRRIRLSVYGLMGALAGLVGIIHASIIRNANPKDLNGLELTVIAAAVIGGASITGGRGTVFGTLLGTVLIIVITRSLVLIGLPSEWHSVLLGLVIVASTAATARGARVLSVGPAR